MGSAILRVQVVKFLTIWKMFAYSVDYVEIHSNGMRCVLGSGAVNLAVTKHTLYSV